MRERALVSVLSLLRLKDNAIKAGDEAVLPLCAGFEGVKLDALTSPSKTNVNQAGYQKLWEGLLKESKDVKWNDDREAALEKASALLEWYGWTVPSATNAFSDISLADHSKAVAIIAAAIGALFKDGDGDFDELFGSDAALGHLAKEAEKCFKENREWNGGPCGEIEKERCGGALFRIALGDLAGIQKFITDIEAKGASRQLKARSFLVDVWADRLAANLAAEFGMPKACRIYATGGKFLLLLPNIEDSVEKIGEFLRNANNELAEIAGADCPLSLRLASLPISQADLMSKGFGKKLQKLLDEELPRASSRPPAEAGFFEAVDPRFWEMDRKEETEFDRDLEELGRRLASADRIVVYGKQSGHAIKVPGADEWIFAGSGRDNAAILSFGLNSIRGGCDGLRYYAGANSPTWKGKAGGGLQFWKDLWEKRNLDEDESDNERRPITFDELDAAACLTTGFGRIGVLRMDVDNLGWLMAKGLDEFEKSKLIEETGERQAYSMGRMMSLSASLVRFFSGLLPIILDEFRFKYGEEEIRAGDLVFTIYSGGDDAFLVGPWFVMPELAMRIRDCFRSWTGRNADVGLSAGIALAGGKFPISVASEWAGDAESAAKNLGREFERSLKKDRPVRKDRMDFLDFTATWNEWNWIRKKRAELVEVSAKIKDQGLIRMLGKVAVAYLRGRKYLREFEQAERPEFFNPGRWKPLLEYSLSRMKGKEGDSGSDGALAREFSAVFLPSGASGRETVSGGPDGRQPIEYLATIVRWADYFCRNKVKKEKEVQDVAG
ncbi:MAG: hypothetical protein HRF49_03675 [bacterium]